MRLILNLANLFLRGTALMFSLISAVAGLACLGGMFSDQLDALTHWASIWLACGMTGLVLSLAFCRDAERKALAGIALTGVVAVVVLMTPELLSILDRRPPPPPNAPRIKLIQFNVWAYNHAVDKTAAWILAQDADVVITEESGSGAWPIIRTLKRAYPYSIGCRSKFGCDTRIFSRWPIVAEHGFYEDHEGLVGAWATLRHPGGDFTVVGNHFVWPIPAGRWQAQSRLLQAKVSRFPHDTLIVTGDFNSTPWSWSLRRQDKALGLQRRTRALATWPTGDFSRVVRAPFPILPIDQVYAGKAWKTVKVERGPSLGSDHRPVMVTLAR